MQHREVFDDVAELYDEVRPGYPAAIVKAIIEQARLKPEGHVLEIGPGTGQMTQAFADRGYAITALELGTRLAARCAQKFQQQPHVRILNLAFENYQADAERYQLLLAAQSFHWIDAELALHRATQFLQHGAAIALVWTLDTSQETAFYQASNPLFERCVNTAKTPELPSAADRYRQALGQHPAFGPIRETAVSWERRYSKDQFLKLLQTFSPIRVLPEASREIFLGEMSKLIDDFGDTVLRQYQTVALLSRHQPA